MWNPITIIFCTSAVVVSTGPVLAGLIHSVRRGN